MGPEVVLISWEMLKVYGGERHGVGEFVYGIIKKDISGKLKEGDYIFSTPFIVFNEESLTGCTMEKIYKLEGPGARYRVTPNDALIMKSTGVSYKTLLMLKAKGLEPKEWYN